MKKLLLFLFLLPVLCFAQNVEVISSVTTYARYQDSLFLASTKLITNKGEEGINDTAYLKVVIRDTATVVNQEGNQAINDLNQAVAKLRAAFTFKTVVNDYNTKKTTIAAFGKNLDDRMIQLYGAQYYGTYRIVGATTFDVVIGPHPTRTDLLRATGTNNEGNFNVQVWGNSMFRIINLATNYSPFLMADGNSGTRPNYRRPSFLLPSVMFPEGATPDNIRVTKIR